MRAHGLDVRDGPRGATVRVRVQPRASREGLSGVRDGALVIRIAAPPVEGQANAALARLIARALGVPPSAVEVWRGASGREKLLRVCGLSAAELRERLAPGPEAKP